MDLVERLRQIALHDWRLSFLAHTSDTAKEAADEIERLQRRVDYLRDELDPPRKRKAHK